MSVYLFHTFTSKMKNVFFLQIPSVESTKIKIFGPFLLLLIKYNILVHV